MKFVIALFLLASFLLCGCARHPATADADTKQIPNSAKTSSNASLADEWVGVYSSPSEIGRFSGTVLVIEQRLNDGLSYRKTFYSDVVMADSIEQDTRSGRCLTDDNRVYVPEAYGYYRDGKPHLLSSVDRYTRVVINGHATLMRDDAYEAFKSENKLYDYGILIKVSDKADLLLDLHSVEHKSIKVLYADETKEWKDPFVSGPNER